MGQTLSHDSLIDRELGHYRVLEKIGEGGMGEVFRAHDEHLRHDVALKVLSPGPDDRARHTFRKEADALSKLNHPNIVTVYDFDTQEDVDFLVMEYVPRVALDERVRQGPLPEKEISRIGVQLADGLAAAHEHGVVHRDLKPGNLRLTRDGRLKILDFGLARSISYLDPLASTESSTEGQPIAGTLRYMAPEQLLGQPLDARTDIYSAGAVLYELAAGTPPFSQALSAPLIDDILHHAPIAPSRIRQGLSAQLETIILKCLAKQPEQRYQSAKDLQADLQKIADSEVTAGPRFSVRNRKAALSALIALLVMAALVAILTTARKGWFQPATNQSVPRIGALAVLPLANLSGDASQDYLADGMTESLITDLGQTHTFRRVISFTSVMIFKSNRVPLPEIAQQLQVDALIEGSVVRSDKTVQVTVRLVDSSDTQL